MARLWQTGFELNSTTTGVEYDDNFAGVPTIVTNPVRSGTYALRVSSLTSGQVKGFYQQFSAGINGPIYIRFYLRVDIAPSADNYIFVIYNGSENFPLGVKLTSTRALKLFYVDGASQIGSTSSALGIATWHRIEIKFDITGGAGANIAELKIDGTTVASSSTETLGSQAATIYLGGNLGSEAQTVGDWYFDDVAINDSTGSNQTSYPGAGKIIHLKPNAAGDVNTFAVAVGGDAGAGNNFTRVDEVTPDDATTYNGSAVLNQEDLFNCENTSNLISSDDTINVVAVGIRMADLVAADATSAFKVELIKTTGGTKSQSGTIIPNSTTWLTNAAAVPRNYPLVTYQDPDNSAWTKATLDTMQIGYILTAFNVQTIAVSTVWASVDYTPIERAVGIIFPYGQYFPR